MHDVLKHFGLSVPHTPDIGYLRELVAAYVRTVPWGSVVRIARKASCPTPESRARDADAFWRDVIERGGDGTCFESNGAFFALLRWLGYQGYLTINNMGETVGCHSAIVLQASNEKWLVDVGLPIDTPLLLDPTSITTAAGLLHDYAALPAADGVHYEIVRSHHPKVNCFTLVDAPVEETAYWVRTVRDHEPDGLFLDKVILDKIIDDAYWRYSGRDDPRMCKVFTARGEKEVRAVQGDTAAALAARFGIDEALVRAALDAAD